MTQPKPFVGTASPPTRDTPTPNVNLAFMHAEGDGVRQDYVAAHMWLSLAAARALAAHRATVVEEQEALAEQMTSDQIAEAERLAREWKPAEQS